MRDGVTSEAEAGVATERLACVTRELMVVSVQRRERTDRRATRVTRELWCEMNAVTLEILAETDGVDAAVAKPQAVPDWGLESRPSVGTSSFSPGPWPALPRPSAIQSWPSAGTSSPSPGQSWPYPRVESKNGGQNGSKQGYFGLKDLDQELLPYLHR